MIALLKPIEEVTRADVRMAYLGVLTADGASVAPLTFERYYAVIAAECVPEHLPGDVRQQFETGRNLMLYSWYCYRFFPVAVLQLFATLELGLRLAFQEDRERRGSSLATLLKRARREGTLRSASFRDNALPLVGAPTHDAPEAFLAGLEKLVPIIRNSLAHGHVMLWPDHTHSLRIVRDALIQLFPPSGDA